MEAREALKCSTQPLAAICGIELPDRGDTLKKTKFQSSERHLLFCIVFFFILSLKEMKISKGG